jgi:hypothetical protein
MRVASVEDRFAKYGTMNMDVGSAVQTAETGFICSFPTCFPCRPPECTQSDLESPEAPAECGTWGRAFDSMGA